MAVDSLRLHGDGDGSAHDSKQGDEPGTPTTQTHPAEGGDFLEFSSSSASSFLRKKAAAHAHAHHKHSASGHHHHQTHASKNALSQNAKTQLPKKPAWAESMNGDDWRMANKWADSAWYDGFFKGVLLSVVICVLANVVGVCAYIMFRRGNAKEADQRRAAHKAESALRKKHAKEAETKMKRKGALDRERRQAMEDLRSGRYYLPTYLLIYQL